MRSSFRIFILIIFAIIAVCGLAACSDGGSDGDGSADGVIDGSMDSSIFDAYIYQPQQIYSTDLSYPVLGTLVHEDRILYWYSDSSPAAVVINMAEDGSDRRETRIPAYGLRVGIGGLKVTDDGNYKIVINTYNEEGNTIIYGVYSPQGAVISEQELEGFGTPNNVSLRIEQVVFADDGSLVIRAISLGPEYDLYLFDNEGALLGQLQILFDQSIIKLPDGRAAALFRNGINYNLHVIDIDTGDWGEAIPLTIPNILRLIPVGSNQSFDLLVDDGRQLYGYALDTHTNTPLLDWTEARLVLTHDYHIGALSDDSIIAFHTGLIPGGSPAKWLAEIYVLTRTPRSDIPEHTVLVLGGFWFPDAVRREVAAFNTENQHYQIELREYIQPGDSWHDAVSNFKVEMITGRGPDIIYNEYEIIPRDSDFLEDLYTFVDADPELDRTDFFPNVLIDSEADDGRLTIIGNSFSIRTLLMLRENAALIDPFTFTSILMRLDESEELHLFADWMYRERFLHEAVHLSGDMFIDLKNNRANLDSEDFISVLEIAAGLPASYSIDNDRSDEWDRLWRGELLLSNHWFNGPDSLLRYQILMDDFFAVGMPTNEGGQHSIEDIGNFSINAGSEHKEAAWEFVRRFLLPGAEILRGLPLRIDMYEDIIDELMLDNVYRGEMYFSDSLQFTLPKMTAEAAAEIREIVDGARMLSHYDETIWMIILEDSEAFFSGTRTVADTVRIMQNRVQTYLDERG